MGGGTDFGACYQSGNCTQTSPSSPSKPYRSPGRGSDTPAYQHEQPQYDYEAERLREEERQRKDEEERKQREQEAKEKFEKTKKSALEMMKGMDGDTKSLKGAPAGPLGLKGLPPITPKLKEASASSSGGSWIDKAKNKNNLCSGALTAFTYFCGGGSEWPYVCCQKGAPYLNHCDCQCYSSSDFECKSYSYCKDQ